MCRSLPLLVSPLLLAGVLACVGASAPEQSADTRATSAARAAPAPAVAPQHDISVSAAERLARLEQRRAALEADRQRLERLRQLAGLARRPGVAAPQAPAREDLRAAHARRLSAERELAHSGLSLEAARP